MEPSTNEMTETMSKHICVNDDDLRELNRAISEIQVMKTKLDTIKSRRLLKTVAARTIQEQLTVKEVTAAEDEQTDEPLVSDKEEIPFWIQFCVDSSLHCLPNIFTAESLASKLWWLSLLTIMLGLTAIHTYSTFSDFMEHPTVTNIAFRKTTNLPYPVLVICGNFMVDPESLPAEINWDDFRVILYMAGVIPSEPDISTMTPSAAKWLRMQLTGGKDMAVFIKDFYDKYGLNCANVFSSCKNPDGHFLNCCDLFHPVFHLYEGRCFTQNQSTFPSVMSPGIHSDFKIDINFFTGTNITDTDIRVYYGTGKEQAWQVSDCIRLTTEDKETSWMQIYPSKINSDPQKELCVTEPTLVYFPDYTYHNCMYERRMATNPQKSGFLDGDCLPGIYANIMPSVLDKDGRRICTPEDFRKLVPEEYNINYHLRSTNVSKENPCAPPCESVKYDVKIVKSEKFNDDVMELVITFPSMEYPEYTEKPSLDWYDYVSLVGGNFGLWLGASIVTFIHLIGGILVHFCWKKYNEWNSEKLLNAATADSRKLRFLDAARISTEDKSPKDPPSTPNGVPRITLTGCDAGWCNNKDYEPVTPFSEADDPFDVEDLDMEQVISKEGLPPDGAHPSSDENTITDGNEQILKGPSVLLRLKAIND